MKRSAFALLLGVAAAAAIASCAPAHAGTLGLKVGLTGDRVRLLYAPAIEPKGVQTVSLVLEF